MSSKRWFITIIPPLNHTITLYTMIIFAITSIPGPYCQNRYTIIKQLYNYIYIFKHVRSLQELTSDCLIPLCHRQRPPPVRRQSPTTTTRLCNLGPLTVAYTYNIQSPTTISEYIHTIDRSLHFCPDSHFPDSY